MRSAVSGLVGIVVHGFAGVVAYAWEPDVLGEHGISPSVIYDADLFSNLAGGVRRGSNYLGNLHLRVHLDAEKFAGLPAVTAFVDGLYVSGSQPSHYAGDAQGVSNIEAPPGWRPYEAWVQTNLLENRFSALAGLYDLNTEFYRLQSGGLFLNSSFGVGPEFAQSGKAGPSIFPNTSVGVRLAFKPAENVVLRVATLDGVPLERGSGAMGFFEHGDGVLLVSEAALLVRPGPENNMVSPRFRIGRASGLAPYEGKIAVGVWHYTTTLDDLSAVTPNGSPVQHRGSSGFYGIGDWTLVSADSGYGQLSAFLQAGLGDNRVDRFGSYVGVGLAAKGFLTGRPDDETGLAVAMARNASHYLLQQQVLGVPVRRAETAIELTYLAQATSWLAVQPDLQYVIHPNTDSRQRNALVIQLEGELSF